MLSINPKRSIVSLAVVAGLLAAAGPAGAQGGGADFTRFVDDVPILSGAAVPALRVPAQSRTDCTSELIDYYCSTIAPKDSSQPEGIIAVLIGPAQLNDGPTPSGELVTDNTDPDKVNAPSGLNIRNDDGGDGNIAGDGRGVDGITADAGAGDDRVRASGLKAGSSELLMRACRDYTDDPLTVNNQRVVLESDSVRQPRSCKWEIGELDA